MKPLSAILCPNSSRHTKSWVKGHISLSKTMSVLSFKPKSMQNIRKQNLIGQTNKPGHPKTNKVIIQDLAGSLLALLIEQLLKAGLLLQEMLLAQLRLRLQQLLSATRDPEA